MAASGNHLLYQQTFQPTDNLYFRLQEGLDRARYGDYLAALVLHTTVILEQANVLRELMQDSRSLYNKVIENTQAVKGLEAKTSAIERQIIEQNLSPMRNMAPCQPPCNVYPSIGEPAVLVRGRDQQMAHQDQGPLLSLARMTHSQQRMDEAVFQRQNLMTRPPSRGATSFPPPPPPLVPHLQSSMPPYSYHNSPTFPGQQRPYTSMAQLPRLYPMPTNRQPSPVMCSRLSLPPPPPYVPAASTSTEISRIRSMPSQSITLSTVITTTAASSSVNSTTSTTSSFEASGGLSAVVLPAGITIIPLGPAKVAHMQESSLKYSRPSVVIKPVADPAAQNESLDLTMNEVSHSQSSASAVRRRKRRLVSSDTNSLNILERLTGTSIEMVNPELEPFVGSVTQVDGSSSGVIVSSGVLRSSEERTSARHISAADGSASLNKKTPQNKGMNLDRLLQRIAEYTQNKSTSDSTSTTDKNAAAPLSVGSRRRKSLTREKVRHQVPQTVETLEVVPDVECFMPDYSAENADDSQTLPIIVSVRGSVNVDSFLEEVGETGLVQDGVLETGEKSSEASDDASLGWKENLLNSTPNDAMPVESHQAAVITSPALNAGGIEPEIDGEVGEIIDNLKSIVISPEKSQAVSCDTVARQNVTATALELQTTETLSLNDVDADITEIVTELVSYIEMGAESAIELAAADDEDATLQPASSQQPKSMTIENLDVFCIARDHILKVGNEAAASKAPLVTDKQQEDKNESATEDEDSSEVETTAASVEVSQSVSISFVKMKTVLETKLATKVKERTSVRGVDVGLPVLRSTSGLTVERINVTSCVANSSQMAIVPNITITPILTGSNTSSSLEQTNPPVEIVGVALCAQPNKPEEGHNSGGEGMQPPVLTEGNGRSVLESVGLVPTSKKSNAQSTVVAKVISSVLSSSAPEATAAIQQPLPHELTDMPPALEATNTEEDGATALKTPDEMELELSAIGLHTGCVITNLKAPEAGKPTNHVESAVVVSSTSLDVPSCTSGETRSQIGSEKDTSNHPNESSLTETVGDNSQVLETVPSAVTETVAQLLCSVSLEVEQNVVLMQTDSSTTPQLALPTQTPTEQHATVAAPKAPAARARTPATKKKFSLWSAMGYRKKKRRKPRIKQEPLTVDAASSEADNAASSGAGNAASSEAGDVASSQTAVDEVEASQQSNVAVPLNRANSQESQKTKISSDKQQTSELADDDNSASKSREPIYLGVTVEGQADVELRTSSKGRVSLFKAVTRELKSRVTRSHVGAAVNKKTRERNIPWDALRKRRTVETVEKSPPLQNKVHAGAVAQTTVPGGIRQNSQTVAQDAVDIETSPAPDELRNLQEVSASSTAVDVPKRKRGRPSLQKNKTVTSHPDILSGNSEEAPSKTSKESNNSVVGLTASTPPPDRLPQEPVVVDKGPCTDSSSTTVRPPSQTKKSPKKSRTTTAGGEKNSDAVGQINVAVSDESAVTTANVASNPPTENLTPIVPDPYDFSMSLLEEGICEKPKEAGKKSKKKTKLKGQTKAVGKLSTGENAPNALERLGLRIIKDKGQHKCISSKLVTNARLKRLKSPKSVNILKLKKTQVRKTKVTSLNKTRTEPVVAETNVNNDDDSVIAAALTILNGYVDGKDVAPVVSEQQQTGIPEEEPLCVDGQPKSNEAAASIPDSCPETRQQPSENQAKVHLQPESSDNAVMTLLKDLIDATQLDADDSGAEVDALLSVASVDATKLMRAIRIWQEHDYSRFPIEVLKLSENEGRDNCDGADGKNSGGLGGSGSSQDASGELSEEIHTLVASLEKLVGSEIDLPAEFGQLSQSTLATVLKKLLVQVQQKTTSSTTSSSLPADSSSNSSSNSRSSDAPAARPSKGTSLLLNSTRTKCIASVKCKECHSRTSGCVPDHCKRRDEESTPSTPSTPSRLSNCDEGATSGEAPVDAASAAACANSESGAGRVSTLTDDSSSSSCFDDALKFKQIIQSKFQTKLDLVQQTKLQLESPPVSFDPEDQYNELVKTFVQKRNVLSEKNPCFPPERNLNIKTLKHRLSFAIAASTTATTTTGGGADENDETVVLQPHVQCVNIFSIHEIWKYLKCFINDASRSVLALHKLGQTEIEQFLVLAKLCALVAQKDEPTDVVFKKTEGTQDLTVHMLEEAIKLLEEGAENTSTTTTTTTE